MIINDVIFLSGIGVISWIFYTAQQKGRHGLLWGLIAAIMYYVPTLGFSKYVFPDLVKDIADTSSQEILFIIKIVITIILALLACGITYKTLEALPNKKYTKEELEAFEEFENNQ